MVVISSAESSIFPAPTFSVACCTSRAPQSTLVMPGWAAVQAMTNCPIVALNTAASAAESLTTRQDCVDQMRLHLRV